MKFVCEPVWIDESCLVIDAYGWGIKGATCALAIRGSDGVVLVEAAHRKSAPYVLGELEKMGGVKWVLVTHRHTDHAGGVAPILKMMPGAKVAGHPVTLKNIADPSRINEATWRAWGEFADLMDPVEDVGGFVELRDGDTIEAGGGIKVEAVHTPGHSSDHYAYYDSERELVYLGDAGGLLSCSTGTVIPASFPSSFNFDEYARSLDKLLGYEPKVIVFAHFGTVMGSDAARIIEECAETLEEWRRLAYKLDAPALADKLKEEYLEKFTLFNANVRNLIFDMLVAGLVNATKK
ncbi:MAG: MBL fold metallo-hydrolase [Candidatus Freyarchaeota archaeon]|nr:MBL fold metallo-hydrolase [Candidatus Jordarchaeia archaeon]